MTSERWYAWILLDSPDEPRNAWTLKRGFVVRIWEGIGLAEEKMFKTAHPLRRAAVGVPHCLARVNALLASLIDPTSQPQADLLRCDSIHRTRIQVSADSRWSQCHGDR